MIIFEIMEWKALNPEINWIIYIIISGKIMCFPPNLSSCIIIL